MPYAADAQQPLDITVAIDHDWINSGGWPLGAEVFITIDDDEDPDTGTLYNSSQISQIVPDAPNETFVFFGVGETLDILAGYDITLTDNITTLVYIVEDLSFTKLDVINDVARGTAPPFSEVEVGVWNDTVNYVRTATTDENGDWVADFDPYDLTCDMIAHVFLTVEPGYSTVAHPRFFSEEVEILGSNVNISNHLYGIEQGNCGEHCNFEVFITAEGEFYKFDTNYIELSVGGFGLDITEAVAAENDPGIFLIKAKGNFGNFPNGEPSLGDYILELYEDGGAPVCPYIIGDLEDIPQDAPSFTNPLHGEFIFDAQPTFEWQYFHSEYNGTFVDSDAYELNLTYPGVEEFTVYSDHIQNEVMYIDSWEPYQPPPLVPGYYELTLHSNHNVDEPFGFEHHRSIWFAVAIEIDIDLKPGTYPNEVNFNGRGVIPVAVLGSADFDVREINIPFLRFEGMEVRIKRNGKPQCDNKDVSGDFSASMEGSPDGFTDLVCMFVDTKSGWPSGKVEASLTGWLNDWIPFKGTDSIIGH
jgi:hypothetical protein